MKVCIVGVGLLGGSFALGLKEKLAPLHLVGVEINERNASKALELGLVHEVLPFVEAVSNADLIVLATPVNIMLQQLVQVLNLMHEKAIVMDLGSTKEILCKAIENHPNRERYVAAHPIAGTENSGPEAAFADLLKKKTIILCEKEKTSTMAYEMVHALCTMLEMRVSEMNASEHDLHLAYVSHLSHISSFALGATVLDKEKDERNIFNMAGSGFSSTVRLAKSSPEMWAPIFLQNTNNISEALGDYIEKLQEFKKIIDEQDEISSRQLMYKANDIRRILSGINPGPEAK
ncbi:MAG: prephenate dehydrogenase [Bacteroidota bacterium]|nr:prephenate dehydrogenase [Bacteroidota bacterium]